MSTSETRRINQCTYTPVVDTTTVGDSGQGFTPKQPFVKQNILGIVFDDPKYKDFMLEQIPKVNPKIKKVLNEMWKGDFKIAVAILNELEFDKVIKFAKRALDLEGTLIENARRDIEESVSTVIEEEHIDSVVTETESILKQEQDAVGGLLKEDVIVLEAVEQEFAKAQSGILDLIQKRGTGEQVVKVANTMIERVTNSFLLIAAQQHISPPVIEKVKTEMGNLQQLIAVPVGRAAISYAKVPSKMAEDTPQSSGYIAAIGGTTIEKTSVGLTPRSRTTRSAMEYSSSGPLAELYEGYKNWFNKEATIANTHEQFIDEQDQANQKKQKAVEAALETMKIDPVGFLHLERLQFTPVGYVRGELVYSLPMLPGETVRLSHREWSRTETEYTKLVATSIETATEDALSEKSELAQSSKTEEEHSSALNASVTASASYGPVQISTSVGYDCKDSAKQSAEYSARHAIEITKKAASRSVQEHKISFRVTTQYEVEEESYREITNPLDRAVRWDFHRMMRKWQIDLYRYGIRLTYDVVVPEPGSYLLRKYIELKTLNDLLAQPNPFSLSPDNISRTNYLTYAQEYGTSLESPPEDQIEIVFQDQANYPGHGVTVTYHCMSIELPEGYRFGSDSSDWYANNSLVVGHETNWSGSIDLCEAKNIRGLLDNSQNNKYIWMYICYWAGGTEAGLQLSIWVHLKVELTEAAFQEWQMRVYQQLADAARAQYENNQQRWKKLRDELLAELNREDALMLRKLEKEEITKNVLRWVLGPAFSFYPLNLPPPKKSEEEEYYNDYYEQCTALVRGFREWEDALVSGGVKQEFYSKFLQFGEIIRFLHQAIEWENVNYVLYPYFWTDDTRWDFKQFLYHADYVHRSFLRAGAARVVLTIRPGFEKAFLSFMETGKLGELLAPDHPYMTVGEELKAMAQTSYPYTPCANEEERVKYTVNPGDTLSTIAAKFEVAEKLILKVNGIEDPESIIAGQVLVIPVNLVDIWYEFTPTGALDVVEGTVEG